MKGRQISPRSARQKSKFLFHSMGRQSLESVRYGDIIHGAKFFRPKTSQDQSETKSSMTDRNPSVSAPNTPRYQDLPSPESSHRSLDLHRQNFTTNSSKTSCSTALLVPKLDDDFHIDYKREDEHSCCSINDTLQSLMGAHVYITETSDSYHVDELYNKAIQEKNMSKEHFLKRDDIITWSDAAFKSGCILFKQSDPLEVRQAFSVTAKSTKIRHLMTDEES